MSANKHVAQVIQGPVAFKGGVILQGVEHNPVDLAIEAGSVAVDLTKSAYMRLTVDDDVEMSNPTGMRPATEFFMVLTQDATGGRAITWAAHYDWGTAGAPDTSGFAPGKVLLVKGLVISSTKVVMYSSEASGPAGAAGADAPTNALDGDNVADGASGDDEGTIAFYYFKDLGDTASADYDIVVKRKVRIIEVFAIKTGDTGGAGCGVSIQDKNGNPISNTYNANSATVGDTHQMTIADPTKATINAGDKIRFHHTRAAADASMQVYVKVIPVA